MSTTRYGLHGHLHAKAGQGAALGALLLEAAGLVSQATGCRSYVVSTDRDDSDAVWITEVWDSEADHAASLQDPAVRALIGRAMPLLDGPPQKGRVLDVLGGLGA